MSVTEVSVIDEIDECSKFMFVQTGVHIYKLPAVMLPKFEDINSEMRLKLTVTHFNFKSKILYCNRM